MLGLLVALAARPPLWVAAGLFGIFAIFHGHAHGTELPEAASPFGDGSSSLRDWWGQPMGVRFRGVL